MPIKKSKPTKSKFKYKNNNNNNNNNNNFLSFTKLLQYNNINQVAVVGNGPIIESDFENLKKYPFIIQFNHARYYDKINRCNLLVVRPRENYRIGIQKVNHLINIFKKIKSDTLICPVLVNNSRVNELELINIKKNKILIPIKCFEKLSGLQNRNDLIQNNTLFNCNKKIAKYNSSICGPSTGAIILSELFKIPFIEKIHVFGMNFNGGNDHIDFIYPNIIKEYCTKCIFNKTKNLSYH